MSHKALWIILLCLVTPYVAGEQHKVANRKDAHSSSKTPVAVSRNAEPVPRDSYSQLGNEPPVRDASVEGAEWALVIVGFATLIVIGWQAIETHRATNTAQESIRIAAAENRPWVLLEFGEYGSRIDQPMQMQHGQPASCRFYVTNYGRTPAKLALIKADMAIGTSLKSPPTTAIIEDGKRFNPQIIPPGETLPQIAELPLASVSDFHEAALGNYQGVEKYLWLRAAIEYGHTSEVATSQVYRTEVCYLWIKLGGSWRLMDSKIK